MQGLVQSQRTSSELPAGGVSSLVGVLHLAVVRSGVLVRVHVARVLHQVFAAFAAFAPAAVVEALLVGAGVAGCVRQTVHRCRLRHFLRDTERTGRKSGDKCSYFLSAPQNATEKLGVPDEDEFDQKYLNKNQDFKNTSILLIQSERQIMKNPIQ